MKIFLFPSWSRSKLFQLSSVGRQPLSLCRGHYYSDQINNNASSPKISIWYWWSELKAVITLEYLLCVVSPWSNEIQIIRKKIVDLPQQPSHYSKSLSCQLNLRGNVQVVLSCEVRTHLRTGVIKHRRQTIKICRIRTYIHELEESIPGMNRRYR